VGIRKRCSAGQTTEERQIRTPGYIVPPGKRAAQALDRLEVGLGISLDGQGPFHEVGMVLLQPEDFVLLAGGTEEARRLHGDGKTSLSDDPFTPETIVTPGRQRVPVAIFLVLEVPVAATIGRTSVVADSLEDLATTSPAIPGWLPVPDKNILGLSFIFDRAALPTICEGRERFRVQTLAFECVVDGPDRLIADDDDIKKSGSSEEGPDDVEIPIRLGLLSPGIGKQDQVGPDASVDKLDQHGRGVHSQPVSDDQGAVGIGA
jgi:hypothetical protein